ncbi:MAG: succinate dehydrogenase assembly factor 2 [Pseudomonadota bacterium]|nr:succinate dehydrogenase assembly factor 2 [Pseudomonadota bacterium]
MSPASLAPSATPAAASLPLDPRQLGRLRWRCRRGMLENDLLLERFFDRHGPAITQAQADTLAQLMDLPDNDLLDLLLGRAQPSGAHDTPAVHALLALLRRP